MENNIKKQILYYNEHKDDLLKQYNHKYIVVSPELQVSSFDALSEGFTYGVENYGYGNFLLKDFTTPTQQVHIISPTITKEEFLTRVEHADALIDEGHFKEHEAAKQHFQSRKAQIAERL